MDLEGWRMDDGVTDCIPGATSRCTALWSFTNCKAFETNDLWTQLHQLEVEI